MSDLPTTVLALKFGQLFTQWPASILQDIAQRSRQLKLDPGQAAIEQGSPVANVYVVIDGSIEVSSTAEDGRVHIRRFARTGSTFGLLATIDGKLSPYSYRAQEPTRLVVVSRTTLLETLESNPHLWLSVVVHFGAFHRMSMEDIDASRFDSLYARLANALVVLATKSSENSDHHWVTLTQEDLAKLFAVTRQTISKELKRLEDAELIRIEYRRITLLDIQALRQIAETKNRNRLTG